MFSNIATTYNQTDASLEIIIMLTITFILWITLWIFLQRINSKRDFTYKREKTTNKDDLKIIEGIWTKIEKLLNKSEIYTFEDLIGYDKKDLRRLLKNNLKKYKECNYMTWYEQAKLALEERWGELKEYQNILNNK